MNKNRLEAFSDGVMAIIITIMVLKQPKPVAMLLSFKNGHLKFAPPATSGKLCAIPHGVA